MPLFYLTRFYSKLVRLKEFWAPYNPLYTRLFLFQTGAIKSVTSRVHKPI